jgi:hypothetical protein
VVPTTGSVVVKEQTLEGVPYHRVTGGEMKRARFSEEQIIGILKAAEEAGAIVLAV